jgi:hypothetical protein
MKQRANVFFTPSFEVRELQGGETPIPKSQRQHVIEINKNKQAEVARG